MDGCWIQIRPVISANSPLGSAIVRIGGQVGKNKEEKG